MRRVLEVRERVRSMLWRAREDAEADEEMLFHLQMEAERLVREKGLTPEEADRRARIAFGGITQQKEQIRDASGFGPLERGGRDLRFALRRLARDRGYSLPVVLTLAVGTGVIAAVFAFVHSILLRPLPYPEPGRLVAIQHAAPGADLPMSGLSTGTFLHYSGSNRVFEEMGVYVEKVYTLTDPGEPEQITMALVSPSLLSTLGVSPQLGRLPTADDFELSERSGVVISHSLWLRRFSADPGVLGRTIEMGDRTEEIVGVMPPGFHFPGDETQVWIGWPQEEVPGHDRASVNGLYMGGVGRLRPGVSPGEAEQDLQRLVRMLPEAFPDVTAERLEEMQLRAEVIPLKEKIVGDLRVPLLLLLSAAGFLFLITWTNAISLSLVRAERQRREVAVARALGAGRAHLASRFAAESAVLAALGAMGGLALALVAVRTRFGLEPNQIPRLGEVQIAGQTLALVLLLSGLTALLLTLVAFLRTQTPNLPSALTGSSRRLTSGGGEGRVRRALVAGQVAIALTLLVSAGLMVRSYWNLRAVELGFSTEQTVTFRLPVPPNVYSNYHASARVHDEVLRGLRRIPGVEGAEAANISGFPLTPVPRYYQSRIARAGNAAPEPGEEWPYALFGFATPGYFDAIGIPMLGGRAFRVEDTSAEAHGVILSQSLARALFGTRYPVGAKVRWAGTSDYPDYTVVGVVGDVPSERLRDGPSRVVYFPNLYPPRAEAITGVVHDYVPDTEMYVLRTTLPPSALAPAIRHAVQSVDPALVVAQLGTLGGIARDATAQARLTMLLLLVAGGTALFLGVLGIYGVLSYAVSHRAAELAVRIALGADPAGVVRMVVRQGAALTAVGITAGLLLAFALSRFLAEVLYEVSAMDPVSFLAVAALLFATALGASYLPARRAASVDPARVLRAE